MSNISGYVTELNQINTELKRLKKESQKLRKRANEVEAFIIDYLQTKNQPGLKFQGKAIVLENKSTRASKKKAEREESALQILRQNGVDNAKQVLNDILEARKGAATEVHKLKISNLKK